MAPTGYIAQPTLLYSLYTSDLDTSVNCFCKILQYVDGIAFYSSSKEFLESTQYFDSALYYLNLKLSNHGLFLSPEKSSAVMFSRKSFVPDLHIQIDQPAMVENEV